MKPTLIGSLLLAVSLTVQVDAQTRAPRMSFESESHDFGKIREADGPTTWRFEFTNVGAVPLVISNVAPSCGCTAPSWTKEPVLPGAKGFVAATYDPRNRPGIFEKTLTVTSNGDPETLILKISGDVIPKEGSNDLKFPVSIGNLKLTRNHVGFGDIYYGAQVKSETPVFNSGNENLRIEFTDVPKHLLVVANPKMLKPGEIGSIEVTYNTTIKNQWGFLTDRFSVLLNGTAPKYNRVNVSANISDDFSKLTEKDLAEAPVLSFNSDTYQFGNVKAGAILTHDFTFVNKGKKDLVIHTVTPSCGCTSVDQNFVPVKAGQTGKISIRFNSTGFSGEQNKTITVVSNDPKNTRVILWLKGTVTE